MSEGWKQYCFSTYEKIKNFQAAVLFIPLNLVNSYKQSGCVEHGRLDRNADQTEQTNQVSRKNPSRSFIGCIWSFVRVSTGLGRDVTWRVLPRQQHSPWVSEAHFCDSNFVQMADKRGFIAPRAECIQPRLFNYVYRSSEQLHVYVCYLIIW